MTEQPIPCVTDGCKSIKFFSGRCNRCQAEWERNNLPPLRDPFAGLSETEEYMSRVGIPRERIFAQTRKDGAR